jgi:hypothetical protein
MFDIDVYTSLFTNVPFMQENIIKLKNYKTGKTGQASVVDTGGDNLVCNAYRARGRKPAQLSTLSV